MMRVRGSNVRGTIIYVTDPDLVDRGGDDHDVDFGDKDGLVSDRDDVLEEGMAVGNNLLSASSRYFQAESRGSHLWVGVGPDGSGDAIRAPD